MDIAEMKPTAKKAPAKPASKGNAGSALATLLIRQAEQKAQNETKEKESYKDTLRRVEKFTREDHLAFRAELDAVLDVQKLSAESLGHTLASYRIMNPEANSVAVTVSLWRKMSEACESGYKPDYSQSWGFISVAATSALQAKASTHIGTEESPARGAPIKKQRGRPAVDNVTKALKVLDGMPSRDLETIGKWIASRLGKSIPFEAIKK